MGQSLSTFAKKMRKRAQAVETLGSDLVVIGTAAMLKEMVEITPVDTSEAISNWQVTLGAPTSGPRPPYHMGRRGSTRGPSASKALGEGLEELQYKQPGQSVFLSNTAPHIVDLDRGSSTQFAGGFVPHAVITFRVAVRNALKRMLG